MSDLLKERNEGLLLSISNVLSENQKMSLINLLLTLDSLNEQTNNLESKIRYINSFIGFFKTHQERCKNYNSISGMKTIISDLSAMPSLNYIELFLVISWGSLILSGRPSETEVSVLKLIFSELGISEIRVRSILEENKEFLVYLMSPDFTTFASQN